MESHASAACDVDFDTAVARSGRGGVAAGWIMGGGDPGWAGGTHFTKMKADLAHMVPPALPRPELLVAVTGVLEIAGAVGLLIPSTASIAAYALIALLIAMLPANVNATKTGVTLRGRPATPLLLRIPLQMVWIGLLWCSAGA